MVKLKRVLYYHLGVEMMKNKRTFLIILCCMVFLTGCVSEIPYSEEEQAVIADCAAHLVLRHSKGYEYKVVDVSRKPFIREEIDETEDENIIKEEKEEIVDVLSGEKTGSSEQNDNETEEQEEIGASLSEVLGFDKNIDAEVMNYSVVDELTKGAYFLEPEEGEKLVTVDIKISNKGKESYLKFQELQERTSNI